jgi:hypothetical protein
MRVSILSTFAVIVDNFFGIILLCLIDSFVLLIVGTFIGFY